MLRVQDGWASDITLSSNTSNTAMFQGTVYQVVPAWALMDKFCGPHVRSVAMTELTTVRVPRSMSPGRTPPRTDDQLTSKFVVTVVPDRPSRPTTVPPLE